MNSEIHSMVKKHYGNAAKSSNNCCSQNTNHSVNSYSKTIGYSEDELKSVPEGANLGLGCGNPLALKKIKKGDTVLDLGSGAGFDAFIAAQEVGNEGLIIGVDMTPEMINKANKNRKKTGINNVEFRQGYIEDLPIDTNSIDVVISNCVINLSPNKRKVFQEAYRVLKPGGILTVSDIVLLRKLPWFIRSSVAAYAGCVAGASIKNKYLSHIRNAGFKSIEIVEERLIGDIFPDEDPTIKKMIRYILLPTKWIKKLSNRYAASINVYAVKPVEKNGVPSQKETL